MWFGLSSILFVACQVGAPTVDPASESARLAQEVQKIDDRARKITALAHDLETTAAFARETVEKGRSTPAEQAQKLQALMKQLEEENAALQAAMDALEAELPAAKPK